MTETDPVRATVLEQAKRATAQASKFATRPGAEGRTGAGYLAWRTELILQHRISVDELTDHWASWLADRDQYGLLVELGFDNPAQVELQQNLEAMIQLAEADLRALARITPPADVAKRLAVVED